MVNGFIRDITALVYAQLPDGIRNKLLVSVRGDAYHIHAAVTFTDERKRKWECTLETAEFEGVPVRYKIPDTFLARLCMEV